MARQSNVGLAGYLRQLVRRMFPRRASSDRHSQRHLRFEPLEGRALLASDLATITGIVTLDTPVVGATINLYSDDGDGIFEPGTDVELDNNVTDGTGRYRFDRLSAGGYFVEQPAQTNGTTILGRAISPLVTVTALQAQGVAGTTIDDFANLVAQTITATNGTPTALDSTDYAGAIGGERDLFVELTSGGAGESVTFDSQTDRLMFSSTLNAQGRFTATYDGNDNDASLLSFGLANVDLTDAGNSDSLQVAVRADLSNATVRLRIYTDATHFSESSQFTIPGTDTLTSHVFDFTDDFATGTGAAGPATFSTVTAIEMIVETGTDGTDGRVTLLGAFGPTVITQNLDTVGLDLVVDKQVTDNTPNDGQALTFTMTVTNSSATDTATNVVLTDTFDFTTLDNRVLNAGTGNTFVLAGDNLSGVWTIPTLAPGETATLTIAGDNNSATQRTNTIVLTSLDQSDTNTANNTDSQQLTPNTLDLVVAKSVDDSNPQIGEPVTFTVTVTNSSATQAATNIVLTDTFNFTTLTSVTTDAGVGNTFAIAGDNQSGIWTIPTLAAGGIATLTISGTNNSAVQRSNAIVLTSLDQFDTSAANDSDSEQITPASLDLVVTKDVSDSTPDNGQAITFTVTVTNSSATVAATNVVLTDTFDFTTLGSITSSAGTGNTFVIAANNQTGTWTIPTLAAGGSVTLTITGNNLVATQRTNSITLTSLDQGDTNAANNTDSEQITPNTLDLVVDKTVNDSTPNNGQSVTFTVTVTNSSATQTATDIVLTDTFDFTTLSSVTSNAGTGNTFAIAGNNQTGTWTIPTLAPGATATLTITGNNNSAAQRTNTIVVTTLDQFDSNAANSTGSVQITPNTLDLVVDKTVNDSTPNNGQSITFTVTVTNSSATETATSIVLTDTFDFTTLGSITSNAGTGNTFAIAANNQTGTWTIPTLAPGATATLTITGNNLAAAQRTNTVVVTTLDQFDTNTANNTDSQQLTPVTLDLVVAKAVNDNTPNNGQSVTFTVTVTNSSATEAATNVVLTDTFDFNSLSGVTTNAGTGNTFAIATGNQSGTWTIPTLAAGATATLTITGNNNSATQRTNAIALTSVNQFDTSTANNTASQQLTPTRADLRIAKTTNVSRPSVGQNVTFTVTLTNDGPDQATGVTVTDILPSGLSFSSSSTSVGSYDNTSGVWTVGNLDSGASATLSILASVTATGEKTNVAQVTASDQFDPDSTPNNNATGEDDRASVDLNSQRLSKRRFLAR